MSVLVEERIAQLPVAFVPGTSAPKAVGLDLGLAALVTLDDGNTVDHPRLLKKYEARLARLQKELHRKQKGFSNRNLWSLRQSAWCALRASPGGSGL
ncbi:transposase [Streptomyces sp. NPDC051211]|uniref:transposase n=1 Tax=Streptomyces sp. NPDC051211 TaxID=3154643 RepID=UPI00344E9A03